MLAVLPHRCTAVDKHASMTYSMGKTGWSTSGCSSALLHDSEDEDSDDLASPAGRLGLLQAAPADFAVDSQSGTAPSKACLSLSSDTPTECPKTRPRLLLLSGYAAYLLSLKRAKMRE